ncbi:type I-E CRISPR-associated protein Cas6/Cse3/CasE [Halomonas sp. CS7]|uniref:Type I-E CRISPR-associated protein Cas6/Cse3/CasE n=1 Tax=Halomonas pelophila TaxID=3151122 RepID=A0ABV1N5S0_9GAMM
MYLTRLTLDPRNAHARRDLADAYDMHRTLVRAFVRDQNGTPERFLWRLESGPTAWATPTLLVQAKVPGHWDVLEALPGYLQEPAHTKVINPDRWVQPQREYRFRLVANPTVTHAGKRYGLAGEGEQLAWLERQGARHGFQVSSALVSANDVLESRNRGQAPITVKRACFEGVLRVDQADGVRQALVNGLGPAKAFGCGLLSLGRC